MHGNACEAEPEANAAQQPEEVTFPVEFILTAVEPPPMSRSALFNTRPPAVKILLLW